MPFSQQPRRTAINARAARLQLKYSLQLKCSCSEAAMSWLLLFQGLQTLRRARAQVQYAPEMELGYDMLGGMTPGRTPGRSPGMTPSRMSPSSALPIPRHRGPLHSGQCYDYQLHG